jgi:hypothetical protein
MFLFEQDYSNCWDPYGAYRRDVASMSSSFLLSQCSFEQDLAALMTSEKKIERLFAKEAQLLWSKMQGEGIERLLELQPNLRVRNIGRNHVVSLPEYPSIYSRDLRRTLLRYLIITHLNSEDFWNVTFYNAL